MKSAAVKIHKLKSFQCTVGKRNQGNVHESSYRGGGGHKGMIAKIKMCLKRKEVSTI